MKRRNFIRIAATATLVHGLMRSVPLFGANPSPERDRFGGWKGKKFEPTGFFRVEKDKRWWMVTPEGNAFLSFGINHLFPDLWNQDYNRDAWKKRFGLNELKWPDYFPQFRTWVLQTCKEFGINTVGVHTTLPAVNQPHPAMPYMQPIHFVDIPHWKEDVPDSRFVDVFSPEFKQHCDKLCKEIISPIRDDPFLLGYAMTDCTMFTEEDCRERPDVIGGDRRKARVGWPRRLRNLSGDAPGKKAYVQTMQDIYRGRISDFNDTYGTDFGSFDALAAAKDWRPSTQLSNGNETRDNIEFLKRVVTRYYETARNSIRRYDTNHLFVGDKINANTDSLDTVLPVTCQYTDLVFYQMYGRYEVQKPGLDRWSKITDKPFINGDSAFAMITDTMPRPYGPVADNLQQRAEWTEEFFRNAYARPEFVGWHYCGLIDAGNQVPRKVMRQHSGLLDGFGNPYLELKNVLTNCSEEMYEIAMR